MVRVLDQSQIVPVRHGKCVEVVALHRSGPMHRAAAVRKVAKGVCNGCFGRHALDNSNGMHARVDDACVKPTSLHQQIAVWREVR